MFDAVIPAQAGIALFFLEKRPSPAFGTLSPHCGEREWISNAR
jgi:hypothetical protein